MAVDVGLEASAAGPDGLLETEQEEAMSTGGTLWTSTHPCAWLMASHQLPRDGGSRIILHPEWGRYPRGGESPCASPAFHLYVSGSWNPAFPTENKYGKVATTLRFPS